MPTPGDASPLYRLTYHFEPTNVPELGLDADFDVSISIQTTDNDTQAHKDDVFERFATHCGFDTITKAKENWAIRKVSVSFADKPWDDWDDLEHDLTNRPGVNRARYLAPTPEAWGPPQFNLHVDADMVDDICRDLEQYYAGLDVTKCGDTRIEVIVSPSNN